MIPKDQIAAIKMLLDDLDLQLGNGNVPGSRISIAALLNALLTTEAVNIQNLSIYTSDALAKPLFRVALRTMLPHLADFIHSHQPEPPVPLTP